MGKTLKRARAKAAREQQQQQAAAAGAAPAAKLPRLTDGRPLTPASSSSKWTAAVSAALSGGKWGDAVRLLEAMAGCCKVPRLGAVQRWVRDADQAGSEAVTARLLDAILRCTSAQDTQQQQPTKQQQQQSSKQPPAGLLEGSIVRHPPWRPPPPLPAAAAAAEQPPTPPQQQQAQQVQAPAAEDGSPSPQQQQDEKQQQQDEKQQQQEKQTVQPAQQPPPLPLTVEQLRPLVTTVPFEPGAGGPAAIHAFPPGTIRLDPAAARPPVVALPVPDVPGALLLQGALSKSECQQIIAAAEAIGWDADVDYTFGGAAGGDGGASEAARHQQQVEQPAEVVEQQQAAEPTADDAAAAGGAAAPRSAARGAAAGLAGVAAGRPASGCVWLADESLQAPLYERVAHLLPQAIDGGALAGINARWRLYRYTPGAVYRPHVDGAWPGSGRDPATGRYVFDAFGDRWSRLTFLVYLNDGFEGGCTTYYTPSEARVGVLDARSVAPVAGNVLIFPHGGTRGSLVHEGSAVTAGAKYVIRTDVLYLNTPSSEGSRRQQQQPKAAGTGGRSK